MGPRPVHLVSAENSRETRPGAPCPSPALSLLRVLRVLALATVSWPLSPPLCIGCGCGGFPCSSHIWSCLLCPTLRSLSTTCPTLVTVAVVVVVVVLGMPLSALRSGPGPGLADRRVNHFFPTAAQPHPALHVAWAEGRGQLAGGDFGFVQISFFRPCRAGA